MEWKTGHTNEENALIVDNYPYGWKRTKIKYWVESVNKKGDRFCSQTLNPKTQKWNKPKKSTYSSIIIMYKNEIEHIKGYHLSPYAGQEDLNKFLEKFKDFPFNEFQKQKIKYLKAYNKTMENVNFEIRARKFKNIETGEIKESVGVFEMHKCIEVDDEGNPINKEEEEEKKKETNKRINELFAYNYSRL